MYEVCSMTSLPNSSSTRVDLLFCSTNKTPSLLPTFPLVARCIALPPCMSRVILTCAKPLSSKPVFAFVTRSPVTITSFSKNAVPYLSSL